MLQIFIEKGLWDEARIFKSEGFFEEGIKAPVIRGRLINTEKILDNLLFLYRK